MTPEDFAALGLDTTFDKVRTSGAEARQEPVSQPLRAPDSRPGSVTDHRPDPLRDPSGNLVRIAPA